MIIKTRLAHISSYHRLTLVEQESFEETLKEIVHQWGLPSDTDYSLLWRNKLDAKETLIIDNSKEWQLFCRLHPSGTDQLVEVELTPTEDLRKSLQIGSRIVKKEDTLQKEPISQSTPLSAPKFAFHSVDPQPIKSRKSYAQKVEEGAQQQKMQEAQASTQPISSLDEGGKEEGEEMSAYDRVMLRSRMQGEGLNHFFGSVMAKRAGHSVDHKTEEASTEASSTAPIVSESQEMHDEDPPAAEENAPRAGPSQEEIEGMNEWLGNAWEKRLKEMGHGENSGSPYAKLRIGKGKERQSSAALEASTNQSERRANRVSNSEEAMESLSPLQDCYSPSSSSRTMADDGIPIPLSYSVPNSRPSSRAGSASGWSFGMNSTRKNNRLGKLFRKSHDRSLSLFSSQPTSLHDSGSATPNDTDSRLDSGRARKISFRSLSEALLRETRSDKKGGSEQAAVAGSIVAGDGETRDKRDGSIREEAIDNVSNLQTAQGSQMKLAAPHQQSTSKGSVTPQKDVNHQINRPTLLRASHSAPLSSSSTAVNLSPVGGITLHISTLGPVFALEEEKEQQRKDNLFDLLLPREIRIKCFQWLARIHEEESYASSTEKQMRFFGKEAAAREFFRLTRVSRSWQSLLLDGQLWSSIDSSLLYNISNAALLRLTRSAGPFVKRMDLSAFPLLSSSLLVAISTSNQDKEKQVVRHKSTYNLPTMSSMKTLTLISLTHLNLQGCRNISTKALHNVLVRLPSLISLNVSSMDVVTDDTCLLLGASLPNLVSLDVSRCPQMSGKGLVSFIQAAQGALYDKALFDINPVSRVMEKQEEITLPLRVLRAVACVGLDILVMDLIGKTLRSLQVLDFSYASDLRDEAIAALVSHPGPTKDEDKETRTTYQLAYTTTSHESASGPFITLTPRQAGGNIETDEAHHRRLISSLKHLCLSSCRKLTDRCCVYLSHAVPNLEFIELANIGANLQDEGLMKLFATTPRIQRIDLEGAREISEKVLEAVTPDIAYVESIGEAQVTSSWRNRRSLRRTHEESEARKARDEGHRRFPSRPPPPPPPGAYLTHLILSHVLKPDSASLLNLIRRCPRLIHLQLDDTKANDGILKDFVALSRQRQAKGAYISLVDCRALTRNANTDLLTQAIVRPRDGRQEQEFRQLEYVNASSASSTPHRSGGAESLHHNVINECDESLIVVKTFFNWEIRSQQRRIQQRKNQRLMSNAASANRFLNRSRRDSLAAALSFIGGSQGEDGEGSGRWGRITNNFIGQGDESDDARGCVLM